MISSAIAARPCALSGRVRRIAISPAPAQIRKTISGSRPRITPGTPSRELKAGASAHGAPVCWAW